MVVVGGAQGGKFVVRKAGTRHVNSHSYNFKTVRVEDLVGGLRELVFYDRNGDAYSEGLSIVTE